MKYKIAFYCFLFLFFFVIQIYGENSSVFYTVMPSKGSYGVWEIKDSNTIKLVQKIYGGFEENQMGSMMPLLSPSGEKLAYIKNNNLWIKDNLTGKDKRVNKEGFKGSKKFNAVKTLISGWSVDESKIVYSLEPEDNTPVDGGDKTEINAINKPLVYGYYVCDLTTRSSKHLEFEGNFVGMDYKNDILYSPNVNKDSLFSIDETGNKHEIFKCSKGTIGQISLSRDGKEAIAMGVKDNKQGEIIKIDLVSGKGRPIGPIGSWAENQFPKISPAKDKISWLHQEGTGEIKEGHPTPFETWLMVDDNVVFKKSSYIGKYEWIDDQRIVCMNGEVPVVIGLTKTGGTLQVFKNLFYMLFNAYW